MNKLLKYGAEALKPQKHSNGISWMSPVVSKRRAKVIRKRAVREGTFGTLVVDPESGVTKGWDPAWDVMQQPIPRALRPNKLHKNQRSRTRRAEKITEKLGEQEKRMDDIRKQKLALANRDSGVMKLLRVFRESVPEARRR